MVHTIYWASGKLDKDTQSRDRPNRSRSASSRASIPSLAHDYFASISILPVKRASPLTNKKKRKTAWQSKVCWLYLHFFFSVLSFSISEHGKENGLWNGIGMCLWVRYLPSLWQMKKGGGKAHTMGCKVTFVNITGTSAWPTVRSP